MNTFEANLFWLNDKKMDLEKISIKDKYRRVCCKHKRNNKNHRYGKFGSKTTNAFLIRMMYVRLLFTPLN